MPYTDLSSLLKKRGTIPIKKRKVDFMNPGAVKPYGYLVGEEGNRSVMWLKVLYEKWLYAKHMRGEYLEEYAPGKPIHSYHFTKDENREESVDYEKGKRIRNRVKSHYMKYYCKHCGFWFGDPQKCPKCKAFHPLRRVEYLGGRKVSSVDLSQIPEDELTEEEQRFLLNKEKADKIKKIEYNLTRTEKRRLAAAAKKAAMQTTK